MTTHRVVLCEDEPLADELLVVGEAVDGKPALATIRMRKPDVVFMDIQVPEMTALEF